MFHTAICSIPPSGSVTRQKDWNCATASSRAAYRKDISLKRNGSDVCAVFEGFMDYLSAMQLGIIASLDWLVLNSVSNVEKAVRALHGYERIDCFLDNDDAGRRTLERLRADFGEKVIDRSSLYADHKDLNEFLLSKNAGNNVRQ